MSDHVGSDGVSQASRLMEKPFSETLWSQSRGKREQAGSHTGSYSPFTPISLSTCPGSNSPSMGREVERPPEGQPLASVRGRLRTMH